MGWGFALVFSLLVWTLLFWSVSRTLVPDQTCRAQAPATTAGALCVDRPRG